MPTIPLLAWLAEIFISDEEKASQSWNHKLNESWFDPKSEGGGVMPAFTCDTIFNKAVFLWCLYFLK